MHSKCVLHYLLSQLLMIRYSRESYIVVLQILAIRESVIINPIAELPGGAFIRYFRGRYVGFSARDGDDTYPYIADWQRSAIHKIAVPNTNPESPLPLVSNINFNSVTLWLDI